MSKVDNEEVEYEIEEGKSPGFHKYDLPDSEFEGERYRGLEKAFPICTTHARNNWREHVGYIDNGDGTASCEFCPFGARLGRFRVVNGKIVSVN